MEIDKINCESEEVTCEPELEAKSRRCSSDLPKVKKIPINSYNKKQIIKRLKDHRFSPAEFARVLNLSRVSKDVGIKYFKERAEYSQKIVANEVGCNDAVALKSIHELLEKFKNAEVPTGCFYEASVVVAAIAQNETHPDSKNLFNISLSSIYMFLADTLMGLPAKPLNKMSAQFLSNAFKSLHDDVANHSEDQFKIDELVFEKMTDSFTPEEFSVNPLGLSILTTMLLHEHAGRVRELEIEDALVILNKFCLYLMVNCTPK